MILLIQHSQKMTKLIQMEDLLLVARDMGGGRRVMCAAISSG